MKLDADAGTQTRVFHFGGAQPQAAEPSWQGYSIAQWEVDGGGRRGRGAAPARHGCCVTRGSANTCCC